MTPEERYNQNEKYAEATVYKFLKNPKALAAKRHMQLEDLFQVAKMSLWQSCLKFDANVGVQFTTYAINNIRRNLIRATTKNPFGLKFSGAGDINSKWIKENLKFVSFDEPYSEGDFNIKTYHEIIGDDVYIEGNVVAKSLLEHIKSFLNDREIKVLKGKLNRKTLTEIGNDLGLSAESIRLTFNKVKMKLKEVELV